MEVTTKNFASELPKILDSIRDCDFLAFDTELTGLETANSFAARANNNRALLEPFETPATVFARIRENAAAFNILQFGLCTFTLAPSSSSDTQPEEITTVTDQQAKLVSQRYLARPYNFYIFSRNVFGQDRRFISQSSSISFLADHKFDFNKTFYEGIGYLSKEQEAAIRKKQESSGPSTPRGGDVILKDEHRQFVEEQSKLVSAWLSTDEEAFVLPLCDPFRRRILYQELPKSYPGSMFRIQTDNSTGSGSMRSLRLTKTAPASDQQPATNAVEILGLEEAIGFRKVIDAVSQSGKLIATHNGFYDILHLFDKFLGSIPMDYSSFKSEFHSTFPKLIDTKLFATDEPLFKEHAEVRDRLQSTALGELFAQLDGKRENVLPSANPIIEFDEGFSRYNDGDDKSHEAGYDAYMTGVCLLRLAFQVIRLRSTTEKEEDTEMEEGEISTKPVPLLLRDSVLGNYVNKLFVMRSDTCLNLAGPDPTPAYSTALFVFNFPADWKTSDLISHFGTEFGGLRFRWVDDTSAFIFFSSEENATKALEQLGGEDKRPLVVPCEQRHNALERYKLQQVILPNTPDRTSGVKRTASEAQLVGQAFVIPASPSSSGTGEETKDEEPTRKQPRAA